MNVPQREMESILSVPHKELVAIVNSATAAHIYSGITQSTNGAHFTDTHPIDATVSPMDGNSEGHESNIRVGNMYFGAYGALGFTRLFADEKRLALVGLVYVPQRLFPLIEFKKGEETVQTFSGVVSTAGERQWNLRNHKATLDAPVGTLLSAWFFPNDYYWKIEKHRRILTEADSFEARVAEYDAAVKGFVQRVDAFMQTVHPVFFGLEIRPDDAMKYFRALEKGEIKLYDKLPTR